LKKNTFNNENKNEEEKEKVENENENDNGNDNEFKKQKTQEEINEEIQKILMTVYESIKEIIPSTPDFVNFNVNAPFTMYSIDSLATRKLINMLARRTKKEFSASTLFHYGTPYDLAKYMPGYTNKLEKEAMAIPKSMKENNIDGKVAINGMALRLPGAINNTKSFWMTLAKGKDCVMLPVKDIKLRNGYAKKLAHLLGKNEHTISKCGCYDTRPCVAKPSEFDVEVLQLFTRRCQ